MINKIYLVIIFLLISVPLFGEDIVIWDGVENATGYRVYYGTQLGVYPNNEDAENNTELSLSTFDLNENVEYYMVVRAYNECGESADSNYVTYTRSITLSKPTGITLTFN